MKNLGTFFLMAVVAVVFFVLGGCQSNRQRQTQEPQYQPVQKPRSALPANSRNAAISDDGKILAVASGKEVIVLRDGEEVGRIALNTVLPDLKFSPRGRYLVATTPAREEEGDGLIVLWDVERKRETLRLADSQCWLTQVSLSPDDQFLSVGHSGHSSFDVYTTGGRKLHTLVNPREYDYCKFYWNRTSSRYALLVGREDKYNEQWNAEVGRLCETIMLAAETDDDHPHKVAMRKREAMMAP